MKKPNDLAVRLLIGAVAAFLLAIFSTPAFAQVHELDATVAQQGGSPNGSTQFPFNFSGGGTGVVMTWWHPDTLGNPPSGDILEFGLQFSAASVNATWSDVDIYLGESTHFDAGPTPTSTPMPTSPRLRSCARAVLPCKPPTPMNCGACRSTPRFTGTPPTH